MEANLPILEVMLRRRTRDLWHRIVKEFEVDHLTNVQVQKWINTGVISERAYDKSRGRQNAKYITSS